jgi:hypothetical protein
LVCGHPLNWRRVLYGRDGRRGWGDDYRLGKRRRWGDDYRLRERHRWGDDYWLRELARRYVSVFAVVFVPDVMSVG